MIYCPLLHVEQGDVVYLAKPFNIFPTSLSHWDIIHEFDIDKHYSLLSQGLLFADSVEAAAYGLNCLDEKNALNTGYVNGDMLAKYYWLDSYGVCSATSDIEVSTELIDVVDECTASHNVKVIYFTSDIVPSEYNGIIVRRFKTVEKDI